MAYEVSEDQFFSRGSSGGTIVSSALEMVDNIIEKRYHPSSWNVYMFQCSDGDNWKSDNNKVTNLLIKLHEHCQFMGYCEVEPSDERIKWIGEESKLFAFYSKLNLKNLKQTKIHGRVDIWPAFKDFFGGVT